MHSKHESNRVNAIVKQKLLRKRKYESQRISRRINGLWRGSSSAWGNGPQTSYWNSLSTNRWVICINRSGVNGPVLIFHQAVSWVSWRISGALNLIPAKTILWARRVDVKAYQVAQSHNTYHICQRFNLSCRHPTPEDFFERSKGLHSKSAIRSIYQIEPQELRAENWIGNEKLW